MLAFHANLHHGQKLGDVAETLEDGKLVKRGLALHQSKNHGAARPISCKERPCETMYDLPNLRFDMLVLRQAVQQALYRIFKNVVPYAKRL
jgi:hypothetical protein